MNHETDQTAKTQLDKFKEAARELGTDDDSEHFKERLRNLAKQKPSSQPPD